MNRSRLASPVLKIRPALSYPVRDSLSCFLFQICVYELAVFEALSLYPKLQTYENPVLFRASFYFRLENLSERFVGLEEPGLYGVIVFHFLAFKIQGVVIFQFLDKPFPIVLLF